MVSATRRSLLHTASGFAALLTGCNGLLAGSTESTRTASESNNSGAPGANGASDPETVVARIDTDRRPVWISDDGNRPTADPQTRRLVSEVIDSDSKANQIAVAADVDRAAIDTFLEDTDFESETIYLQSVIVEECFRLELCQINWGADSISTDYGRRSRPYDDPCDADNELYSVWFIRIPQAIDADDVSSYSSSVGGSPCDDERTRTTTVSDRTAPPTATPTAETDTNPTETEREQS